MLGLNKILRRAADVLLGRWRREKGVLDSGEQGFGGYELKVQPGTGSRLIVAFSGVGDVARSEVRFEWGNSLVNACPDAHVIYVKDNLRHWYTDKPGQAQVVAYLEAYVAEHGINRSLAFGLSMGGYGALVFASLMRFDHVVALAPRSCVGRYADFDTRNKTLMSEIEDGDLSRIGPALIRQETRYTFVASRDQINDLKHMSLLRKVCPGGDFYFSRGDHNIGHEMVLRGEMSSFLQWVASGCENAPPAGVMRAYEPLFEVPQHLLEEGLHGVGQRAWGARFSEFPVEELPIFLLEHKVQQLLSENSALCHYPCPLFTSIGPNWIRHYLGAGWYAPDQSGVWSQGLLHQLRGGLVEFGTPECRYAIRFDVELYPDDRDKEPLYLDFFQGLQPSKRVALDRKQKAARFSVPLCVDAKGHFDLLISTPFASMPAARGKSEDSREIALYLKSFIVVSTDQAPKV